MWPSLTDIPAISTHQGDTLARSLSRPLGILAGTPGTGKTYTVAAVVKAIVSQCGAGCVAIACPTGKAAVRCTTTMRGYGLDLEATTIHRLLGVQRNGHDGKGWGFIHGPGMPLPYHYVIIDESSMLGTSLAASLFSAISPGTHVLLVGDPYQLPPVEHGAPLRDMIAAGVPTGELTEIWRNDGGIVRACRLIKEGNGYQPSHRIDVPAGHNLKHNECRTAEQSLDVILSLYRNAPPTVDRFADIQVLCTVKAKSQLSTANVNKVLQDYLLPDAPRIEGIQFRLGDKVICKANTTMLVVDENGEEIPTEPRTYDSNGKPQSKADFVANGEIGRVVRLKEREIHVAFDCPRRTVKAMVAKARGGKSADGDASNGDDATANASDFELAYGITIHKSQGSSWKVPIIPIDDYSGANFVACRELYYTAISRTETLGVTCGRMDVINRHCQRVSLAGRKTMLKELLGKAV